MAIGIVRAIEELNDKIDSMNSGEWVELYDNPNMFSMITERKGELMVHFKNADSSYVRGFVFKSEYEVDYEKEGLLK